MSDEPMKALSLWQPWASFIAVGAKWIETRSWSTRYRGPIAIHASQTYKVFLPDEEADPERKLWTSGSQMLIEPKFGNDETWSHGVPFHRVPLGAVVATARLVDCVPMVPLPEYVSPSFENHPDADLPYRDLPRTYIAVSDDSLWLVENGGTYTSQRPAPIADQRPYGDFAPGRFGWLLDDVVQLDEPIPAKGKQGLWNWDPKCAGESRGGET